MNIELENIYDKWDDSLTYTEGYIFDSISELTEIIQNGTPVRVYFSGLENLPFFTRPTGLNCKYFYKVRDIEDKRYIVHDEFKPELIGKAGVFCDNLEDIEALIDPANFVPLVLKDKGIHFPFFNGKGYYKYFIETPSLKPFPDDICPLQPGDIIRERGTNIKYMVVGIDEGQESSLHVKIPMAWASNEDLFKEFYKVTEYGDSVIGVMEQPED